MKVKARISFIGARLGMTQGEIREVEDKLAIEFIESGHVESAEEEKKSTKAGADKGKSKK